MLRMLVPKRLFQNKLSRKLVSASLRDVRLHWISWVNYYNKLSEQIALPSTAPRLVEHKMGKPEGLFFDTYQYTRWFLDSFQWGFLSGRCYLCTGISFYR